MRILILNDLATPTGGAEINSIILRDGLRRRGHDARLFASSARPRRILTPNAADYICYGTFSWVEKPLQFFNPFAFFKLRRVLDDFRPDVVSLKMFTLQMSPFILLLLRRFPSVYHVDFCRTPPGYRDKALTNGLVCVTGPGVACGHPHETYGSYARYLCRWFPLMIQTSLWRRWYRGFSSVVAVSESMKRRLESLGAGHVEVIPNGVPVRPARPRLSGPPTVAFAGRLVHEKGIDTLVRAFAKTVSVVPDARLVIVGEGAERRRLESLVGALGLSGSVFLTGWLTQDQMEEALASAWVQAVPSVWDEPHPLAALEAQMRGTAVVASACGGIPEIVRDGTDGLLVPPGDVDALAAAMTRLVSDRELCERMGQEARRGAVERFGEDRYVESFERLYTRLTGAAR